MLLVNEAALASEIMSSPDSVQSDQTDHPIFCTVVCTSSEAKIFAEITFSNITDGPIAVFERNLLRTNEMTWAPFEVRWDGKDVPYTGPMIKRSPPGPGEFYLMKPHEVFKEKTEIGKYYDFSQTGRYSVSYFAVNPAFGSRSQFLVESKPAIINVSP